MADSSMRKSMKAFFKYVQASPTAAHAITQSEIRLKKAGFVRFDEGESWEIGPGTKGYIIRGASGLVAFRIGSKSPQEVGFRAVGAHSDSPGLRLKPKACYSSDGYLMLGVEVYGGPIWSTWTDRDLSLAGRVIVDKGKGAQVILADLKRPICRIPQLAIHLNRKVNDKGGQLNAQKHLPPVLGLGDEKMSKGLLESMLAKACGVTRKSILDYTLDLYDTQAPGFGGLKDEFYFSGRIDNLAGCFSAVEALVEAPDAEDVNSVIALFDNEEIGSGTFVGAGSTLLDTVFERLCMNDARPRESLLRALSKTILVSSDGAHAVHPNYADMHDKHHHVQLNGGPVIKVHAKQKYASTAETSAYFMNCAKRADAPCQVFANRSDLLSGSTIGPISSTRLGVPAVDAGVPMLSMHSIREMGGVDDLEWMKRILIAHFTTV